MFLQQPLTRKGSIRRVSVEMEDDETTETARNFTRRLGQAVRRRSTLHTSALNAMSGGASQQQELHAFDSFDITLEDLRSLKTFFDEADVDKGGSLTMEEFVKAFAPVVGGSEESLRRWFMRIDANVSGTLDWEEFSSFLLLSSANQDGDAMHRSRYVKLNNNRGAGGGGGADDYSTLQPFDTTLLAISKEEMATALVAQSRLGKYYTAARDGKIRAYNQTTLEFDSLLHPGGAWITDMQLYADHDSKLSFCTLDKFVGMYDLNSAKLIAAYSGSVVSTDAAMVHQIKDRATHHHSTQKDDDVNKIRVKPLSSLHSSPTSIGMLPEHSIGETRFNIALGLESGHLHIYPTATKGIGAANTEMIEPVISAKIHSDAISALRTCKFLDGILTASWDSTIQVYSLELEKVSRKLGSKRYGHTMAVKCLSACDEHRIVASCGADRVVNIWNPYMERKPIFTLEGHNAPLVSVTFNTKLHQILSLSEDKVIKIWDIRTFRNLQTIYDKEVYYPENHLTAMAYDDKRASIVCASSSLRAFPLKIMLSPFPQEPYYYGHQDPLVSGLYNRTFNQVVTADVGRVQVWDGSTGQRMCSFSVREEDSPEDFRITKLIFDECGRRLLVGSNQKHVRLINYANGQLLKEMSFANNGASHYDIIEDGEEVTAMLFEVTLGLPMALVAVGNKIHCWHEQQHVFVESVVFTYELAIDPDELRTRKQCTKAISTTRPRITSMTSFNNKSIAVGTQVGLIFVLSVASWDRSAMLGTYQDTKSIEHMVYSGALDYLVACASDGTVSIYSMKTRSMVIQLVHTTVDGTRAPVSLHCLAATPTFTSLIVGDETGRVHVWDVSQLPPADAWEVGSAPTIIRAEVIPAIGNNPQHDHQHDVVYVRSVKCHKVAIKSVNFLPVKRKSSFFLTASSDCQSRLFSMIDGKCVGYVGQRTKWEFNDQQQWIHNLDDAPGRPPSTDYLEPKETVETALLSPSDILQRVNSPSVYGSAPFLPDIAHHVTSSSTLFPAIASVPQLPPAPPPQQLQQQQTSKDKKMAHTTPFIPHRPPPQHPPPPKHTYRNFKVPTRQNLLIGMVGERSNEQYEVDGGDSWEPYSHNKTMSVVAPLKPIPSTSELLVAPSPTASVLQLPIPYASVINAAFTPRAPNNVKPMDSVLLNMQQSTLTLPTIQSTVHHRQDSKKPQVTLATVNSKTGVVDAILSTKANRQRHLEKPEWYLRPSATLVLPVFREPAEIVNEFKKKWNKDVIQK